MCGIAALLRRPDVQLGAEAIETMTRLAAHRGPDGHGTAFLGDGDTGLGEQPAERGAWKVALGHQRLSIIDLSDAGYQPMSYQGRLWVTFNGEIYNYLELRRDLERLGHRFRSNSDTEVLLAAYVEWGPACFERFHGMWGLVLVDAVRRCLVLSRDRLGIKPLYLYRAGGFVAVVSEIKQLTRLPGVRLQPDRQTVQRYLATGYEDTTRTFFAGVCPLPAGTWQQIDLDSLAAQPPHSYWHPERVEPVLDDPGEAARAFADVFQESVRLHLRSDVPVGCALSGGLDSSAIAGLVQHLKGEREDPLHTFTATFPGEPIDERPYVDRVVAHVGATPHFVAPTAETFLSELDAFTWQHDEPVGSLSQYAGYCVARLTREAGVPVTLNGQGADEIFSGYWQTYFLYLRRLLGQGRLLRLGDHMAGALLPDGNGELIRQVPVMARRFLSRKRALRHAAEKMNGNGTTTLEQVMDMSEQEGRIHEIRELFLPRLLKWDDRNFMAFSVEGRYPFLDHKVIALLLTCTKEVLYHHGWTKHPLRNGLAGILPSEILWRRTKFAFETPQDRWLAGPMQPALRRFLEEEAPLWELLERDAVRRLAGNVPQRNGRSSETGQALARLFLLDRWMRCFDIDPAYA